MKYIYESSISSEEISELFSFTDFSPEEESALVSLFRSILHHKILDYLMLNLPEADKISLLTLDTPNDVEIFADERIENLELVVKELIITSTKEIKDSLSS